MVLHRREAFEPEAIARVQSIRELVGPHRTRADVAGLASSDGVVERPEGSLDRGIGVPAVDLIQVDRLHAQPF